MIVGLIATPKNRVCHLMLDPTLGIAVRHGEHHIFGTEEDTVDAAAESRTAELLRGGPPLDALKSNGWRYATERHDFAPPASKGRGRREREDGARVDRTDAEALLLGREWRPEESEEQQESFHVVYCSGCVSDAVADGSRSFPARTPNL